MTDTTMADTTRIARRSAVAAACLAVAAACTGPTEARPALPCYEDDTLSAPVTLQRMFDPPDCAIASLDAAFTGSVPGGAIRYHGFVMSIPPQETVAFRWVTTPPAGLAIRVYDADGEPIDLDASGAPVANPGFTAARTIQVLVVETQGTTRGDFHLEVTGSPLTAPVTGRFHLKTIGGQPLPANIWSTSNFIDMVSSVLDMRADGSWEMTSTKKYYPVGRRGHPEQLGHGRNAEGRHHHRHPRLSKVRPGGLRLRGRGPGRPALIARAGCAASHPRAASTNRSTVIPSSA